VTDPEALERDDSGGGERLTQGMTLKLFPWLQMC
jgi:hypothetical protein